MKAEFKDEKPIFKYISDESLVFKFVDYFWQRASFVSAKIYL